MKLIASCVCRNELHRYLEICVAHLLEFVDEVRIYDDGSTDGWQEEMRHAWGNDGKRVLSKLGTTRQGEEAFNRHALARNELLRFTLEGWPTHILAIDLDEFVSDGAAVRRACEGGADLVSLEMCEVWTPCEERLCVRQDGGWRSHGVGMLWRPEMRMKGRYRIADQGPATGRTPAGIWQGHRRRGPAPSGAACFHFGWAREAERQERYQRYALADGGRFHAKAHLDSILWPPGRVKLEGWAWPAALKPMRAELLARSGAKVAT